MCSVYSGYFLFALTSYRLTLGVASSDQDLAQLLLPTPVHFVPTSAITAGVIAREKSVKPGLDGARLVE